MHWHALLEGLQHKHKGGEGKQPAATAIMLVLVKVCTAAVLLM